MGSYTGAYVVGALIILTVITFIVAFILKFWDDNLSKWIMVADIALMCVTFIALYVNAKKDNKIQPNQ